MPDTRYLPLASASEALPPLLDTALLIRAPEGLEPSRSGRCPAHTMNQSASRPQLGGTRHSASTGTASGWAFTPYEFGTPPAIHPSRHRTSPARGRKLVFHRATKS